jgi:hypothetical protein
MRWRRGEPSLEELGNMLHEQVDYDVLTQLRLEHDSTNSGPHIRETDDGYEAYIEVQKKGETIQELLIAEYEDGNWNIHYGEP